MKDIMNKTFIHHAWMHCWFGNRVSPPTIIFWLMKKNMRKGTNKFLPLYHFLKIPKTRGMGNNLWGTCERRV